MLPISKYYYKRGKTPIQPRKRNQLIVFISLTLLLLCYTSTVEAEETTISIICTNSILADFTKNLLPPENVTITYIMPAGACPAQYDITPSDINKIISADIVISIGLPLMEGWLEDLLAYNPDCSKIETTYLGEWNLPPGAKKYVEILSNELSILLPVDNDTIKVNTDKYLEQINETAQNLQEMIIANNTLDKKIICMNWQKDFIEWLGLNVSYSYGPTPSTQDKLQASDAASRGDVYVVVDNLQSGTDFGAQIASESGISHVIFTNFPEAIPGTDTYLDMITYNTQQLLDGIATCTYKQGEIANLENQLTTTELQRNAALLGAMMLGILTIILFIMYKKK
jgi:ABC-type Zn uptake system ZnuABC Zn-binding protein ZnuA